MGMKYELDTRALKKYEESLLSLRALIKYENKKLEFPTTLDIGDRVKLLGSNTTQFGEIIGIANLMLRKK